MTAPLRGILLDIEGTTTPVAFVYNVLFPFARAHLRDFLEASSGSSELRADLENLRAEHRDDVARGLAPPPWPEAALPDDEETPRSVEPYLHWLIDRDRKSPGLKSIQGRIWERGYSEGTLKGQVFPDLAPSLVAWQARGLEIRIYSSGSVLAQKLIFGHSEAGDLTSMLSGYFDTAVGPKTSEESYKRIAAAFGCPAPQVLFVSDVTAELDAARACGMQTRLCVRPGNRPQPHGDHLVIHSLAEIE